MDIGELEDFPSNKIPGYYERLKAMLPSLIEHRCSYEERGGFLRRVEEGTWPAHPRTRHARTAEPGRAARWLRAGTRNFRARGLRSPSAPGGKT